MVAYNYVDEELYYLLPTQHLCVVHYICTGQYKMTLHTFSVILQFADTLVCAYAFRDCNRMCHNNIHIVYVTACMSNSNMAAAIQYKM